MGVMAVGTSPTHTHLLDSLADWRVRWQQEVEIGQLLSTLPGTEFQPADLRKEMRCPGSPL